MYTLNPKATTKITKVITGKLKKNKGDKIDL